MSRDYTRIKIASAQNNYNRQKRMREKDGGNQVVGISAIPVRPQTVSKPGSTKKSEAK